MRAEEVWEVLQAWIDAWNTCDTERMPALVHDDFRMHRLKGDVIDRQGLLESIARQTFGAALRIHPQRLYGRDGAYATVARMEFVHVESGEVMGTEEGGLVFELRDGLMALARPQPSGAAALELAGLTEDDLMPGQGSR